MAKTIDVDLLQKERDDLEKSLTQARQNVETAKNQVMSIIGAIQMTDRLIVLSKEGNYSRSRANSDGVPEEKAAEVQKSLEEHAKDMVSELGDDDLGKVD
jgi:outer membrane protein TolC|tara:strand:+ start:29 stop:328 length:300 start_codon:yes stop_codon:yes gene_type:complete